MRLAYMYAEFRFMLLMLIDLHRLSLTQTLALQSCRPYERNSCEPMTSTSTFTLLTVEPTGNKTS